MKSSVSVNILLELTPEEALWIKARAQNALYGTETEEEEERVRTTIFKSLPSMEFLKINSGRVK